MSADVIVRVPARVDVWVVVAVAVGLVAFGAVVTPLLFDPAVAWWAKVAVAAMGLAALALTLGTSVPVAYRLEPEGLTVRAGLLTLRLAYRDIVRAERRHSPLSGPSWSVVRLRIWLAGGGWVEVAPRDREALLAELARRAPHLRPTPRGLDDPRRRR